jgi:mono/diheme cytochrome c family protein
MKKIFVIIILAIAVASCAHKTVPTQTATTTTSAGDAVAGKQIYIANCGRCHGLKNTSDYTSDEWVPLVDKMAHKAKLSDSDKANVLAYVQANAKQG